MANAKQEAAKKKAAAAAKGSGPSKDKPKLQSTELATTKKDTAISTKTVNDMLLEDQGAGQENMRASDLAIPRISVLQSLSDQCVKGNQKYDKTFEPGDFFDNVLQTVMAKGEEGFLFIPVSYRSTFLEWTPRSKGGGFAGDHGPDEAIMAKTKKNDIGQDILPNGNEVILTAEYYAIILDLDGQNPRQAVISFSKTQLKKARRLNTSITQLLLAHPDNPARKFNPAMFYSVFKATTVPESNDKGSWMGWNIVRFGNTTDLEGGSELYLQCRQFRSAVSKGEVKVAAPDESLATHGPQSDDDKL